MKNRITLMSDNEMIHVSGGSIIPWKEVGTFIWEKVVKPVIIDVAVEESKEAWNCFSGSFK